MIFYDHTETHKRLKRTLFNQTKLDRMQIFREIPFFQSNVQYKNKLIQFTYISFASWILAEGRGHETDIMFLYGLEITREVCEEKVVLKEEWSLSSRWSFNWICTVKKIRTYCLPFWPLPHNTR